jgi:glycosyltransferase involved in cell wall biosynthesis
MRILIANNRFFISGGPERYLFNVIPELEKRGHAVIPFALGYSANDPSPYARYFPKPPVDDFILHGDRPLSAREKISLAAKVIHDPHVFRCALRVLREEKIDLVYALQIAHYLYPEIILAARDAGVPVVWRQSDYQLICPAYSSFRDDAPCELCDHGLLPALRFRCLKGSLPVTGARLLAMWYARMRAANRLVARIVCPSKFLYNRLLRAGYPPGQLVHIPTPVPPGPVIEENAPSDGGFILFVGGFYRPKGAHVAIAAAKGTSWKLVLVGDTSTQEGQALVGEVRTAAIGNVEFAGIRTGEDLVRLYRSASAVVVPSVWYENAPNVVLEAQSFGKVVIASDMGSLKEMISDGVDGLLFPPGDSEALASRIGRIAGDAGLARKLGTAARARVQKDHRLDRHVDTLETLFDSILSSRRP